MTLIAITLLSLQISAIPFHIAWLKKIFDKQCTILFSAISEMKGAKKSELDSEHVLDISKIFLADNLQCCVTFCVKSIILVIFGNNIQGVPEKNTLMKFLD